MWVQPVQLKHCFSQAQATLFYDSYACTLVTCWKQFTSNRIYCFKSHFVLTVCPYHVHLIVRKFWGLKKRVVLEKLRFCKFLYSASVIAACINNYKCRNFFPSTWLLVALIVDFRTPIKRGKKPIVCRLNKNEAPITSTSNSREIIFHDLTNHFYNTDW